MCVCVHVCVCVRVLGMILLFSGGEGVLDFMVTILEDVYKKNKQKCPIRPFNFY